MLRRSLFAAAVALLLAACSNCDSPCSSGVNFYVTGLAGSLAPGSEQDVTFCVDGKCDTVTVSRDLIGGTVFVAANVGAGDHTVTVKADGGVSGTYTGPLDAFQQPGGDSCDSCDIGAIKVAADGTLTPGVAVPNSTTSSPATTGG